MRVDCTKGGNIERILLIKIIIKRRNNEGDEVNVVKIEENKSREREEEELLRVNVVFSESSLKNNSFK